MKILYKEIGQNARTHIYLFGIKIFSLGHRKVKAFHNPKLGISYSVWDGEELLEQSIRQIRPVADYINVVWQRVSWHGNMCNTDLENTLIKLKSMGLIDELIFFEPDLKLNPTQNEQNKRNLGLRAAQNVGCTHFMTMNTDEFYETDVFRAAYQNIIERNLSHTVCNIVCYLTPTIRYRDYATFFVPFIHRIDANQKITFDAFYDEIPCLCDPTRKIKLKHNSRFCFLGEIVMHHMKHVRKDIRKKLENSSANQSQKQNEELTNLYILNDQQISDGINSGKYIRVPNQFNIEV
ncbi:MAG: hypothetical protein K2M34_01415 [Alphaproteobacteria bacterium]|nr:hypothetical protein [Alphaproteobacteria bacterium]